MAVRKQKTKTRTDAHELVKKAQSLSKRPKHAKNKTGFKTQSDSYLNQVPILGDKGVIYTTPQSGGNYYFRTWIPEEKNSILFGMSKQFDELSNFILNEMRMSHIYQPVMLIELLNRQGSASTTEIAKSLLGHDVSQVEYYEHITKNMVGKVLTQSRGVTSKDKN
ncbi:MAG: hypothetical protein ACN4E2_00755 [Nitrospinota bacterium]